MFFFSPKALQLKISNWQYSDLPIKPAKGRRRMRGVAQFLCCFEFIHQQGKSETEGGIGLAVSLIFHVGDQITLTSLSL